MLRIVILGLWKRIVGVPEMGKIFYTKFFHFMPTVKNFNSKFFIRAQQNGDALRFNCASAVALLLLCRQIISRDWFFTSTRFEELVFCTTHWSIFFRYWALAIRFCSSLQCMQYNIFYFLIFNTLFSLEA